MACPACGGSGGEGLCATCAAATQPYREVAPSRFVGRGRELGIVGSALDEAARGRGRVVLITGDPGIGKTRLVTELAARARDRGARVLSGGCYEGEWAPPFGPFAEALTPYVRATDAEVLRTDLGGRGAPLTRVIPA